MNKNGKNRKVITLSFPKKCLNIPDLREFGGYEIVVIQR